MSSKIKVIITGGSGFIGTNLMDHLIGKGYEVLNLDILPPRNHNQTKFWHKVDILDFNLLDKTIFNFSPSIIYHLAARTDLDGLVISDYDANTVGVKNLIRSLAKNTQLKKVIFASSRLVCKIGYAPSSVDDYCPDTAYGHSKVMGEKIIRAMSSQIPGSWTIVRPTSIWGPWFDVPYKNFFMSILRRQYFHPTSMRIKKSFGFVGNSVHQLFVIGGDACKSTHSETLYLADYDAVDIEEMANIISAKFNRGPILNLPIFILKVFARIGDFLKSLGWKNPPLTTFRLENLIKPMEYDLEPMRVVAGPLPYSLHEGIEITCKWIKKSGRLD